MIVSCIVLRLGSFQFDCTHHRVVCKIGRGLIGRRGRGRALPARDVDGIQELAHLSDHRGLEAAIGVASLLVLIIGNSMLANCLIIQYSAATIYLPVLLQDTPQLLRLDTGGVIDGQIAALGDNLLGSEGTLGEAPPGVFPPVLDSLDILRILAVLILVETHGVILVRGI